MYSIPRLFIFGAGGHTKQVVDIFRSRGIKINGFFDDSKKKGEKYYYDHKIIDKISNAKNYLKKNDQLFCGIGDNLIRQNIFNQHKEFEFVNCISPLAIVSHTAKIGQGNYVGNFVNLMPDSVIGSHNIINDGSLIGHDASIGDFNLIAAFVCCGAHSKTGNSNLIGINVSINPSKINIGNNNIIGSGTVVINDIMNNSTVVGLPGKIIKIIKNK
jgi:acetyltransferase EpsM